VKVGACCLRRIACRGVRCSGEGSKRIDAYLSAADLAFEFAGTVAFLCPHYDEENVASGGRTEA
jgi:hypothetical protein